MSALAITWAISPPIVPAPTTAALKTNMAVSVREARREPISAPNRLSVVDSEVVIARRMNSRSTIGVTGERRLIS